MNSLFRLVSEQSFFIWLLRYFLVGIFFLFLYTSQLPLLQSMTTDRRQTNNYLVEEPVCNHIFSRLIRLFFFLPFIQLAKSSDFLKVWGGDNRHSKKSLIVFCSVNGKTASTSEKTATAAATLISPAATPVYTSQLLLLHLILALFFPPTYLDKDATIYIFFFYQTTASLVSPPFGHRGFWKVHPQNFFSLLIDMKNQSTYRQTDRFNLHYSEIF